MIDTTWFNPYPPIWNILTAIVIIAGLYMLSKYFWMVVYEIRWGLGDEYISGKLTPEEIKWMKEKYPLFNKPDKDKMKWSKK